MASTSASIHGYGLFCILFRQGPFFFLFNQLRSANIADLQRNIILFNDGIAAVIPAFQGRSLTADTQTNAYVGTGDREIFVNLFGFRKAAR